MSINGPPASTRILKRYPNLLRKLAAEPQHSPDQLLPYVLPVVVLESELANSGVEQIGDGWFSEGLLTAAIAETVHAQTPGLEPGVYEAHVAIYSPDTGLRFQVMHRDAADSTTLNEMRYWSSTSAASPQYIIRFVVRSEGEFLRAVNLTAPAAGQHTMVSFFLLRVA